VQKRSLAVSPALSEVLEPTEEATVVVPAVPSVGANGRAARVVLVSGPQAGATHRAAHGMVIGRGSEADIRVESGGVSRLHARIERDRDKFAIVDLESRNGTFVNGERVTRRTIAFGDRIQLGAECVLLFTVADPMDEELARLDRMQLVGRMSATLAHDFNNLLHIIRSSFGVLGDLPLAKTFAEAGAAEAVEDGIAAVERGANLISRLLTLSRPAHGETAVVEVDALIQDVARMSRRVLPGGIELAVDVQPFLKVRGNEGELHQVLMNLCVNARDAMPRGGVLELRTRASKDSPPRVVIEVRDTGVGMTTATRARLFEPFFTTKAKGGNGLGLAGAMAIVKRHNGSIDVDSDVGRGSVFRIVLPAVPTSREHMTTRDAMDGPKRSEQRESPKIQVLVVDDDPLVLRTMARQLQTLGHQVTPAMDADHALDAVCDHQFDLAILDLHIGEESAIELVPRLRARWPELPVVVVSGLWSAAEAAALRGAGVTDLLGKPCGRAELEAAIARHSRPRGGP
jgi:signal transduction histidine kinase/ActR/RegA family two-component response regulator